MLKSVRWIGFRSLMRNVHWLNALAAATTIVSFGPRSSSDAKSTAYEPDVLDGIGRAPHDVFALAFGAGRAPHDVFALAFGAGSAPGDALAVGAAALGAPDDVRSPQRSRGSVVVVGRGGDCGGRAPRHVG